MTEVNCKYEEDLPPVSTVIPLPMETVIPLGAVVSYLALITLFATLFHVRSVVAKIAQLRGCKKKSI